MICSRPIAAAMTAAALLLGGCTDIVREAYVPSYRPINAVPAALRATEFDYDRRPIELASTLLEETETHKIKRIALASSGQNGQAGNLVTARYYQSKHEGPRPLVLVLPIWGKHKLPPDMIIDGLRRDAVGPVDVLHLLGEDYIFDWDALGDARSEREFIYLLDQMVGRFADTVVDIRRLVDWAEAQPDVDPDNIGLVGFSVGAIAGGVVMANEPRLDAAILVMGGAAMHETFAVCGNHMGRVRRAITRRFGWTVEEFKARVEPIMARVDVTRMPGRVDPRKVLIIEAGKDTCIPEPSRDGLWRAMGQPERVIYNYGHKLAFITLTFVGGNDLPEQVYRFLDKSFRSDPPAIFFEAGRPVLPPTDGSLF